MRELKFRAWDNEEKRWLLGYEYKNLGGFSMFGECMLFEEWSAILNRFILQQKDRTPSDLKLMQYTGLKDKNGKEVYEGDILKTDSGLNQFVEYRNDMAMFVCRFKNGASTNISVQWEIIGNIYENPELIK